MVGEENKYALLKAFGGEDDVVDVPEIDDDLDEDEEEDGTDEEEEIKDDSDTASES